MTGMKVGPSFFFYNLLLSGIHDRCGGGDYVVGRQNTAWKEFGYIPTNWTDPSGATGLPTREASRTEEVGFLPSFPPLPSALSAGTHAPGTDSIHSMTLPSAKPPSHWARVRPMSRYMGIDQWASRKCGIRM